MEDGTWASELAAERRARDRLFQTSEGSPLPPEQRAGFPGLSYFEPNGHYRARGVFHQEEPARVALATNRGTDEAYTRVGTVRLLLPEGMLRLAVFERPSGRLFIPFSDATTGRETHAVGRRVDVEHEGDGRVLVDLNRAYHPAVAYNPGYTAVLPPRENALSFALRVGERLGRVVQMH